MDHQSTLEEIADEIAPFLTEGKVADHIPALAGVEPKRFGMSLALFDGTQYSPNKSILRSSLICGRSDSIFSQQTYAF